MEKREISERYRVTTNTSQESDNQLSGIFSRTKADVTRGDQRAVALRV